MSNPVHLILSKVPEAHTAEIKEFIEDFGTPQTVEKILNPNTKRFEGFVKVILQTKWDIRETIDAINGTPFKDTTIHAEIKADQTYKKAPLLYEDSNNPFPFSGFSIVTKNKKQKQGKRKIEKTEPIHPNVTEKDVMVIKARTAESADQKVVEIPQNNTENETKDKDKDKEKEKDKEKDTKPPAPKRDRSPPRKNRDRKHDSDYDDDFDRKDRRSPRRGRSPSRRDRSPPDSRRGRSPSHRRSPPRRDYSPERDPPRRSRSPARRDRSPPRSPPRKDRSRSPGRK
ncbi:hypothetical protein TVAG_283350 [Trichomonas vaginalis G3]|uniref:RRM domain-containing protein n=1 Tax=Trichomonas vaginalis (strain ATCC PRA-98 / G3) TaxID=412133 RepID=A2DEN8_TRIV3|nr:RNA-binding domain, RBD family-containing protein [Trichomonas vaginalis G3]EAY21165.1 hypothetical protein TVAG_283350 [Trichomonas vaginalis G3]KAI5522306.1 RNA-binding domain, RBD family-containing protein [Trichomonas vaginalis G3]|eukprot:XP_001582151.1 hypothetical protein [Trichomonas vaginalis G3]